MSVSRKEQSFHPECEKSPYFAVRVSFVGAVTFLLFISSLRFFISSSKTVKSKRAYDCDLSSGLKCVRWTCPSEMFLSR